MYYIITVISIIEHRKDIIMLSLLLTILVLWLCWKLGIGLIKVIGFLIAIGLIFFFAAYLLIPILAICIGVGILKLIIS